MEKAQPNLNDLLSRGNLIRPEELAAGLGVAKPTIYLWAKRGMLPCVRLQGCVRFDPVEISAWLEEKRSGTQHLCPPAQPQGAPD